MKRLIVAGLVLLGVAMVTPGVEAQGMYSDGASHFIECQDSAAVPAVSIAGKFCVHFSHPQWALSNTAALRIAVTVSGPGILTGVSVGITASNSAQVGCSTGPGNWIYTLGTGSLASGFGASARAVLTMAANECQAVFRMQVQYSLAGGVVLERNFEYAYSIYVQPDLRVDNLNRLCAASALGAACDTPTIDVAQSGTWTVTHAGTLAITLDGMDDLVAAVQDLRNLTLSGGLDLSGIGVNVTVGNTTLSFPDVFHLCGAIGDPGECSPLEFTGSVDQTQNISLVIPLIILLLVIIYAEITRDFVLFLLAVIIDAAIVMSLWPEIEGMRSVLVALAIYLIFRGYLVYKDPDGE